MTKTDISLRNITVAAIKRSARQTEKWKYTNFYPGSKDTTIPHSIKEDLKLGEKELLVASFIPASTEWTIVSTRRIFGKSGGILREVGLKDIESYHCGEFKDKVNQTATIRLTSRESENYYFHIETREASMVMINAIRTLVSLNDRINNGS